MAIRFIAGISSSILFIVGVATFYFGDSDTVLPLALFTFPTVFILGIPLSILVDYIMKHRRANNRIAAFFIESILYGLAGNLAIFILFWCISGNPFWLPLEYQLLGVTASYLYFLIAYFLRHKS